jgi:oligoendopeptidase F
MVGKQIPERKDIPQEHRWDLTPLFQDDESWESLFVEIENKLNAYNDFKGRLKDSPAVFRDAVAFDLSVSREVERLYTYAHLKSDQDKSNQFYLGLHQRAITLATRASELSSFLTPEIQALPDDVAAAYLDDDRMDEYRFYLYKILRYKPHTRNESEEKILAMSREVANSSAQVFGQLDNVDLNFGSVEDENGKEIELSHGNFSTFLINPHREVRHRAFFQYYQAYDNHKHTLAATLTHSLKKDLFYARVRHFETCRAQPLFADDVSEEVYDNLIDAVKDNLSPLYKYLDFRSQALGLDSPHFYDTYVPIVKDVEYQMPYEKAVDICAAAVKPLGKDYARILKAGLLGGWVDKFENRGKRSGAYSSGCYDSPPYILLNYEENNLNSLYTLIHEAGHSMHSYFANQNQPYVNHAYTIFVAEVASTFNEDLLSRYLLKYFEENPKMKAYILNREIDNIRATLFRQTMFAEFEKNTHSLLEANRPLTLEVFRSSYRELLETYFGNTIEIDDQLELECLRIPHFYSAFYVYKYATGVSAAIALAQKVVTEGRTAREAYLNFLKLGGCKFPLDELLDAGVDMRSPEPIRQAIAHFDKLVDQLVVEFQHL